MGNVADKSCRENKTHILCSVNFSENRAVNERMWKNVVELDRAQMTISPVHLACQITNARVQTHTEIM